MEDPRYFNFLRFIKLIIIYHGKIHQTLHSNISKVSSSYPYNLFKQLFSTLSNQYISKILNFILTFL